MLAGTAWRAALTEATMDTITLTVDAIAARLAEVAQRHGFTVRREARSGLSCSRYLSIAPADGRGFHMHGKAARSVFCRETGMPYPRDCSFNIRVSDHHGYGGQTDVHASIRLDGDVERGLARVDAALALLATLPVKP